MAQDDLFQDENEFRIGNKICTLYLYTATAIANENIIPKRKRYPTGQRLESMVQDMMDLAYEANCCDVRLEHQERHRLQRRLISKCYSFEGLINSLVESTSYPGVTPEKGKTWMGHSKNVRHMTLSWMNGEEAKYGNSEDIYNKLEKLEQQVEALTKENTRLKHT